MSSNTNIGNTPVNQGYVQLIHMGETGGIDGTLRALYDGDGTASDLLIASDKVKISTELYIGSKTLTEFVQDTVGAMFSSNTETNITVTYQDGDGTIDLVSSGEVTLTGSETLTNKTLTSPVINTGISGTAILDEDNMASNSATKLSTQQSIKAYVDAEVAGVVNSAPSTLDTLDELAAALGDDANFATTTATSLGEKLVKSSNLSDLTNAGTARSNLGLGSVATLSSIAVSNLTASAIQISSESFADNDTTIMTSAAIQDKIESFGYSTTTGTVTNVSVGSGLDISNSTTTPSITLDLTELADMTEGVVSADELILLDGSTLKRKAISEITLSTFSDSGFNHGAITALNNATANELVTVGSTTTELDAESGLTYDGDMLTVSGSGGTDGAAGSPTLRINNTVASSDWDTGDVVGALEFYSADTSGNAPYVTSYIKSVNETGNGTLPGGALSFGVADYNVSGGAVEALRITEDSDIYMLATKKLYFDGGSHTYIDEPSGDQIRLVAGGTEVLKGYSGGAIDMYGGSINRSINIGANRTADAASFIDLVGDTTYTDYGARLIRNSGANAITDLAHRGTGGLRLRCQDAGAVLFMISDAEKMRISSSGNVGIGTTSPSQKLQVAGHTRISGVGNGLYFDTTGSTESNVIATINDYETLIATNRGSAGFGVIGNSDIRLGFGTSYNTAQTKLYINGSSGNVGIGTTSPSTKMHIKDASNNVDLRIETDKADGMAQVQYLNDAKQYNVGVNNTDSWSVYDATAGATRFSINSSGDVGIKTSSPQSELNVKSDTNSLAQETLSLSPSTTDNSQGGLGVQSGGLISLIGNNRISMYTGGGVGDTEALRIDSSQDAHFDQDVIAFSTTPSDIRLKKNFTKIENGLDVVSKLEGHTFNWKKGGERLSAGFKAQEVEKVLPHLVDEKKLPLKADDDKEYKILRYEEMIPYLVEAIKELKTEIEEFKNG